MSDALNSNIRWVSDYGIEAGAVAGEDFWEFGVPIESIYFLTEFIGYWFGVDGFIEIGADEWVAALNIVGEVG